MAVDFTKVKHDFPLLGKPVRGQGLVFLDSASSTQKPQVVIDRLTHFYQNENANVHRGVYWLSEQATAAYEAAREQVAAFVGAHGKDDMLVFTRGTTEAINLVAYSYGRARINKGDEILVSQMEHHSNWVPWQVLAEEVGAHFKVIPLTESGDLDMDAYRAMLSSKTALVAVTHVSNTLGVVNPVKTMAAMAHKVGAKILVDGAQAVPHQAVDFNELDVDFYAFSGHKCYGPMGIGALLLKRAHGDEMVPYQTGGGMIQTVSAKKTTFTSGPEKFEAGTPNVAGAVGMARAVEYLQSLDLNRVESHESHLWQDAVEKLSAIKSVRLLGFEGRQHNRAGIISLVMAGVHAHDLASILDVNGVACRAGHHCTMPLMKYLDVPATLRVSFGVYNTTADNDVLVAALEQAQALLGRRS